jgi:hypothetical protein
VQWLLDIIVDVLVSETNLLKGSSNKPEESAALVKKARQKLVVSRCVDCWNAANFDTIAPYGEGRSAKQSKRRANELWTPP